MIFYFEETRYIPENPKPGAVFPCAYLAWDKWNDYGYETLYPIAIYSESEKLVYKGAIKIMMRDPEDNEKALSRTVLPESPFESLDEKYCSLGDSLEYYEALKSAGPDLYQPFLVAMRDSATNRQVAAEFQQMEAFKESLLRFSDAEKAFHEAGSLFNDEALDKLFEFTFECKVPGADESHVVNLNFAPDETDLHRTVVLIGKNGTGKTQFLAGFAQAMSGLVKNDPDQTFIPRRPSFARVIAVSYSVFDDFDRPAEGGHSFSYKYCGIRKPSIPKEDSGINEPVDDDSGEVAGFLSRDELRARIDEGRDSISSDPMRKQLWSETVSILLEDHLGDDDGLESPDFFDRLSSGQRILVAVMTQIIDFIKFDTIILFDEPELHLHPEVFAALARALDHLLKSYNSYAIIATHSPMLLQETFSRQVKVFRRQGNIPIVTDLTVESFGENLSTITREVFAVDGSRHNFRAHLSELLKLYEVEEIEKMFPLGLPLQARAYLLSQVDEDTE